MILGSIRESSAPEGPRTGGWPRSGKRSVVLIGASVYRVDLLLINKEVWSQFGLSGRSPNGAGGIGRLGRQLGPQGIGAVCPLSPARRPPLSGLQDYRPDAQREAPRLIYPHSSAAD